MKNITFYPYVILFLLASFTVEGQSIAKNVNAKEFSVKITELKNGQLLDVRTPDEWKAGRLSGAKNINFYDADFSAKVQQLDKTKPVLVYCGSGKRSGSAMEIMKGLGFTEIYNLDGGIGAWRSASLPEVK